jgi:hypothetical protein
LSLFITFEGGEENQSGGCFLSLTDKRDLKGLRPFLKTLPSPLSKGRGIKGEGLV